MLFYAVGAASACFFATFFWCFVGQVPWAIAVIFFSVRRVRAATRTLRPFKVIVCKLTF